MKYREQHFSIKIQEFSLSTNQTMKMKFVTAKKDKPQHLPC
jgi:hypothetical protein